MQTPPHSICEGDSTARTHLLQVHTDMSGGPRNHVESEGEQEGQREKERERWLSPFPGENALKIQRREGHLILLEKEEIIWPLFTVGWLLADQNLLLR